MTSRYDRLIAAGARLPPTSVAVAHPCDATSIESAMEAMRAGIIRPILVGPRGKIAAAAQAAGVTLDGIEQVDAPHSDAAAEIAVGLVREGRAEALMKGSLHTDELMRPVVAREGLRTKRRVSHCFVMDVPGHADPLIISDAAVNIAPTLADRKSVV